MEDKPTRSLKREINPEQRKLTAKTCENARATDKPRRLSDGYGLFLELHPNGSKYWRFAYRFCGKQRLMALGVYPSVSLKEARGMHEQAWKLAGEGKDPAQHVISRIQRRRHNQSLADQECREHQEKKRRTFKVIALEWLEKQSGKLSSGQYRRIHNSLANDIFPQLGEKPVGGITVQELKDAIGQIEKRGSLDMVRRVRARCENVFDYAIALELCTMNPAANLKKADVFQTYKSQNFRSLPLSEIGPFLREIENRNMEGRQLSLVAIKFTMLTAARTSEVIGAKWSEFELEGKAPVWNLPVERMKNGLPHVVPLSKQVVRLLRRLHEMNGDLEYLFPNGWDEKRPMSNNAMLKALKDMGWRDRTTIHGFRQNFSTAANESGKWNKDAIERQMSHVERNAVRGAYNKAEYLPERQRLMQWWADHLDQWQEGGKVIPLEKPRSA